MNYEQKYNDLVKRLREYRERFGNPLYKELGEEFPELCESEDERIRKAIGAAICGETAKSILEANGTNLPDALSYLEKKKEQTQIPLSNIIAKAFENSKTDYSLEEREKASDYSERVLPTSITYGEDEDEYRLHKVIEAAYIAGQKEQKPNISDEAIREGVAHFGITQYQINNWLKKHINVIEQKPQDQCVDVIKMSALLAADRLASAEMTGRLKERKEILGNPEKYGLQKPAEWSEEDEKTTQDLIDLLWIIQGSSNIKPGTASKYEQWLKSLRPSWKPIEEQRIKPPKNVPPIESIMK